MTHLEYINNAGEKTTRRLTKKRKVLIGRSANAEIYTTNPSVSRKHGEISYEDGAWMVRDLGSSNGTFVNDGTTQETKLNDNDQVRFGDFEVLFVNRPAEKPDTDGFEFDQRIDEPKKSPKAAKRTARPTLPPQKLRNVTPTFAEEVSVEAPAKKKAKATSKPAAKKSVKPKDHARVVRPKEKRPIEPAGSDPADQKHIQELKEQKATQGKTHQEKQDKYVEQIKEQGTEIESLRQTLKEHKGLVLEVELRNEELETRTTRYEVELDSITEKYVQLKDQISLQKQLLEEAREESAEKDDLMYQLEARCSDSGVDLDNLKDKWSDANDQISSLKIKVTQKDRQLEELQRQYDLMEFELRSNKEELQSLQEGFNSDAGDTQKLERRINQLREIIADKENVISELRVDLENKDIEIRQARMGSGMEGLEEEKQKLLQDFYDKNREVDTLTDQLKESEFQQNELNEKIKELSSDIERRSKAEQNIDVSSHPDYKAKVRELQRMGEQLTEQQERLESVEQKLSDSDSGDDDTKQLKSENTSLKRKVTNLTKKLDELNTRLAETPAAEDATDPDEGTTGSDEAMEAYRSQLASELDVVNEMFAQWRGNFSLFKTNLVTLTEVVRAVADAENDSLPDDVRALMTSDTATESADTVDDLIRVVSADSGALKKGLSRIKKALDA
jgi:pSer/pThr/pTyr-binding forkhead associated (FHA) protein